MKKKTSTDKNKMKRVLKYSYETPTGYFNGYNNITFSGKDADVVEKKIFLDRRNFKVTCAGNLLAIREFPTSLTITFLEKKNSSADDSRIIMILLCAFLQKIRRAPELRFFPAPFSRTPMVLSRVSISIFREFLCDSRKSGFLSRDTVCLCLISMLCSSKPGLHFRISLWYRCFEELLSRISAVNSRTAVLQSYVADDGSRVHEFVVRRTLGLREFPVS